MTEKQEKLIKLLEDMFQLNQTDLDFGIYRIMNAKSDEIKEFLYKELPKKIVEELSKNQNNSSIKKELNDKIKSFKNDGFSDEQIENNQKIKELKEKLSSSNSIDNDENEIYSYLTNFFSRYYKDGDFVSLRRYKKDTYAIPYEGEEVKLHWANSDQYYIKTSENFRDYTFNTKTHKVHFKLQEADTSTNNNKSDKRVFVYQSHEEINKELFIYFTYEDGKNHIFPTDIELKKYSLDESKPTAKNKTRTLLDKHLTDYTAKNSFDYFIHKDLNGFLSRELDFFIKNEILYIDDILEVSSSSIENSLNKIKTFKTIANKIIAFLSQLEEFQKKLWLKKKFVIDTNYCITLDKIDESYYEEIFDNNEQLEEWKELFKIEVKSIEDLKEEKFLVLDTKFFDDKFKSKLLSEFDDIDEECDGVLINSENFGALNLLQDRYKEQIKTVYIDPPYNTGNDGFLYNDTYKHSSWMSFINDRLLESKKLISREDGLIYIQCDKNEDANLKILLDNTLGSSKYINTIAVRMSSESGNKMAHADKMIPKVKESIHVYKIGEKVTFKPVQVLKNKFDDEYSKIILGVTKEELIKLKRFIEDKNIDESQKIIDKMIMSTVSKYSQEKNINADENWKFDNAWRIFNDKMNSSLASAYTPSGNNDFILTKSSTGILKLTKNNVNIKTGGERLEVVLAEDNLHLNPCDIWTDMAVISSSEGVKGFDNGKKPEKLLNRIITMSTNKNDIVLDYHLGSGTTTSVAHKLNRKYIAIEMANYFDSISLKRMKLTLNNKGGGIKSEKQGGMLKYLKLESYEDSLNNLAFKNVDKDLFTDDVKEDYLLNYMLDYETNESLLNIDAFKTPFDYKLKIASSSAGETVETNVDLVETFNYLIGLKVEQRRKEKGYLWIRGENLKEEKILVIWRDFDNLKISLEDFIKTKQWDIEKRDDIDFDLVYINGDNNLANLKTDVDHFKVKLIEEEFKAKMFGE